MELLLIIPTILIVLFLFYKVTMLIMDYIGGLENRIKKLENKDNGVRRIRKEERNDIDFEWEEL